MNKAPIGCLLLHGLSSDINCIDPVIPRLDKYHIPYRAPWLRGHGTKPEDLRNVSWQDWYADGEKALKELFNEADKVVIVSISMGCLVGLDLALAYQEKIAGVTTIAACLKLKNPLQPVTPLLALVQKKVIFKYNPKSYIDQEMGRSSLNYKWIPTSALVELVKYMRRFTRKELVSQLKMPFLIIATTNDLTVDYRKSQWLFDNISSSNKELKWFYRSGHEMLRDGEREQVLDEVEKFVVKIQKSLPVGQGTN